MPTETDKPTEAVPDYLVDGECLVPDDDETEIFVQSLLPALPKVDTKLPLPSPGLYAYYSDARHYGIADTIAAIVEVGRIWSLRYPDVRVGIGDISKEGGGPISGHKSHRKGIDADIRLQRADGAELPVRYQDETYSLERTQELVDLFHATTALATKIIFFNDPRAHGVDPEPNHDNHLHVRFHAPESQAAPPVLGLTSRHPAVWELQRRLNWWIATSGTPMIPLVLDGDFGTRTRDAVNVVKAASGLPQDGIATAEVWAALPEASPI